MRIVITRPQADGERSATALRTLGHEVLVAPLMKVDAVPADLSGHWGAVIVTSANAPGAIANNSARDSLITLPLVAVGQRSADAAQQAGFMAITTAGGDVGDLVRMLNTQRADAKAPLLYIAGEDRAADLIGELSARGIAAELRVVYRTVTMPLSLELTEALEAGEVDAVLHFSRRSAENYLAGAKRAGVFAPALLVRHFCLSTQVAEPLIDAGTTNVAIATRPNEAALIELLRVSKP
jgi:uroporphyrinogen-III synthase